MHDLVFLMSHMHRQRSQARMEEARIERFLAEKKNREAAAWQQRRHQRQRSYN